MIVDYFDVGVGNFGTSQYEHEDQNGKFLTGCGQNIFPT